jgi:hypothetical protein
VRVRGLRTHRRSGSVGRGGPCLEVAGFWSLGVTKLLSRPHLTPLQERGCLGLAQPVDIVFNGESPRLAQLRQGLLLQLPHSFASNAELLTDLLQGTRSVVEESEPQSQEETQAWRQLSDGLKQVLTVHHSYCDLIRCPTRRVLDEVLQGRLLFADRCLQRDRVLPPGS